MPKLLSPASATSATYSSGKKQSAGDDRKFNFKLGDNFGIIIFTFRMINSENPLQLCLELSSLIKLHSFIYDLHILQTGCIAVNFFFF